MVQNVAQELPLRYGIIFLLFIFIVAGLGSWFSIAMIQTVFKYNFETQFLASLRTALVLGFLVIMFPMVIAVEVIYCRWKEREFRVKNVLVGAFLVGEAILIMAVVTFVFEFAFPKLSFERDQFLGGLALGLTIGLPVVAIGLTVKIPEVRAYLSKAFE